MEGFLKGLIMGFCMYTGVCARGFCVTLTLQETTCLGKLSCELLRQEWIKILVSPFDYICYALKRWLIKLSPQCGIWMPYFSSVKLDLFLEEQYAAFMEHEIERNSDRVGAKARKSQEKKEP